MTTPGNAGASPNTAPTTPNHQSRRRRALETARRIGGNAVGSVWGFIDTNGRRGGRAIAATARGGRQLAVGTGNVIAVASGSRRAARRVAGMVASGFEQQNNRTSHNATRAEMWRKEAAKADAMGLRHTARRYNNEADRLEAVVDRSIDRAHTWLARLAVYGRPDAAAIPTLVSTAHANIEHSRHGMHAPRPNTANTSPAPTAPVHVQVVTVAAPTAVHSPQP